MTIDTDANADNLVPDAGTMIARGTVTRDPELLALTRIFKMLDDLAEPCRDRVVRYIAEKYEQYIA